MVEFRDVTTISGKKFGFVRVKDTKISPYNVRPEASPEEKEIKDLAKSIKELGLQQLPVCTSKGEVYIGGRRKIAMELNNEEWMLVEIRDLPPLEQMLASYSENFHRREPDYWNEGILFKKMMSLGNLSYRELAKKLGLSKDYVAYRVKITNTLNKALTEGITFDQARILSSSRVPEKVREKLVTRLKAGEIDTKKLIKILAKTDTAKEMLETTTDEIREKIEEEFKDQFYTEHLDLDYLDYRISKEEGSPITKLKPVEIPTDKFNSIEEARNFFRKCGGQLLGKRELYYGKIDPYKYKSLLAEEE